MANWVYEAQNEDISISFSGIFSNYQNSNGSKKVKIILNDWFAECRELLDETVKEEVKQKLM